MIFARKLNPFLEKLGSECQEKLLEEKWLLTPSLRVGQQWLDSLSLSGIGVVNCRLFTMPGMALRLASTDMNRLGVSFCNEKRQVFILDGILGSLSKETSRYFSKLIPGLSLSKRVCLTLNALELAGIDPDDISPHKFESYEKYEDILMVFRRYRNLLQEMKLVDYSDVLKMAARAVIRDSYRISVTPRFFIIPTEIDLCELELRLIDSLPAEKLIHLGESSINSHLFCLRRTEQELIGAVLDVLMNKDRERKIEFFSAMGVANEVREVLRRCATEKIPFDDVEIVHTDQEAYIPTIYETLLEVCPDPSPEWSHLPVTFADGITAGFSRPGRALRAWLDWMRNDFPQAALVHMIEDGLLNLADVSGDSHFLRLGRLLRGLVIVNGRDRYLPSLRKALEQTEGKTSDKRDLQNDTDIEELSQLMSDWRTLYGFMESLLRISIPVGLCAMELIDNVKTFVSEFSLCVNEMDNYARLAILDELETLLETLLSQSLSTTFDILEWARSIPANIRILGSGPKPGHLHVSHISNGGHSGRRHVFIVGLDEERFPGSPSIDPLLLDEERQSISKRLPTSWKNHEQKLLTFLQLLCRQTGNLCFSYSTTDLSDDSSYLPSSVFRAAQNFCYSHPGSEGTEPNSTLRVAAFVPIHDKSVLTSTDWWLQRVLSDKPPSKEDLFQQFFPHLWRGLLASDARASDIFTEYDGNLLDCACDVFDPIKPGGPILSVQKLETFAKCPLAYFFRYVLSVTPPSEPGMENESWLDPLETGSLLHEVFRVFIEELMRQGRIPLAKRDQPRLHSILHQYVGHLKAAHPPPSTRSLHRQIRLLENAVNIFLVEEEIACRSLIPRFVEVSIGLRKTGVETDLDQETPECIEIDPGVFIRVQGKVDRIDESPGGPAKEFIVWDYKTGGTYRYQHSDLFHQGRNLQHCIYTAITAALLKKRIHPEARVSKFGYYFPTLKGRGIRIVTVEDATTKGFDIINGICRMMGRGCFPPTNNAKDDCSYCEYAEVCGDVETVAAQSLQKIKNEANKMLNDFKTIREVS